MIAGVPEVLKATDSPSPGTSVSKLRRDRKKTRFLYIRRWLFETNQSDVDVRLTG
jgi:hypothetical protein